MPEVERPKTVERWGSIDGMCQRYKALGSAPAMSTHVKTYRSHGIKSALLVGLLLGMGTGLALEGRTRKGQKCEVQAQPFPLKQKSVPSQPLPALGELQ